MTRLQSLPTLLTDDVWRYAIVVGLASAAYMDYRYLQSSSGYLDLIPVFFVGLLGGYLYNERETSRRIGIRVGLVGSIALLWPAFDMLVYVLGLAQPQWFSVFEAGLVLVVLGFGVLISMATGVIGATLGSWLAKRTGRRQAVAGS